MEQWIRELGSQFGSTKRLPRKTVKEIVSDKWETRSLFTPSLIDRGDKFLSNEADEAGVGYFYFEPVPSVFDNA